MCVCVGKDCASLKDPLLEEEGRPGPEGGAGVPDSLSLSPTSLLIHKSRRSTGHFHLWQPSSYAGRQKGPLLSPQHDLCGRTCCQWWPSTWKAQEVLEAMPARALDPLEEEAKGRAIADETEPPEPLQEVPGCASRPSVENILPQVPQLEEASVKSRVLPNTNFLSTGVTPQVENSSLTSYDRCAQDA